MYEQKKLEEYKSLGYYLEKIRKGKHIPYRVFKENGLSVSTYQRVVKEEADLKLSDLAIITEVLCLSPLEVNMEAENASLTVSYRKRFIQFLETGEFEEAQRVYKGFREYIDSTSFTLGKLSVMYMFQALLLLHHPQTIVTKEEALATENKILKRLEEAEVFTLFDIEFLALQYQLNLQRMDSNLFLRLLRETDIQMTDFRTKLVLDNFFIQFTLTVLEQKRMKEFNVFKKIISDKEFFHSDWFLSVFKRTLDTLEKGFVYGQVEKMKIELSKQKEALEIILTREEYMKIAEFFTNLLKLSKEL